MDITSLATAMSSVDLQGKVGTAVLSKSLDMNEVFGAELVQLIDSAAMERSVNPAVGSNFDVRV